MDVRINGNSLPLRALKTPVGSYWFAEEWDDEFDLPSDHPYEGWEECKKRANGQSDAKRKSAACVFRLGGETYAPRQIAGGTPIGLQAYGHKSVQ